MTTKLQSFLILLLFFVACKKDNTIENAKLTVTDLVVPGSFHWETSRDVNLSIGITDDRFLNNLHVVAIYLSDPANGGTPISKGSASLVSPFNTKISLPSTVKDVYVLKTAPDGTTTSQKLSLTSNNVSTAISSVTATQALNLNTTMAITSEPDCKIQQDPKSTSITVPVSIDQRAICYMPTDNHAIDINANQGGTLKLNAPGRTITINNFNHTSLDIYITSGTTVIFKNSVEIKSSESIYNEGTLLFNGLKLAGQSSLQNAGSLTVTNNFETDLGSTISNNSNFDVAAADTKLGGTFNNNKAANFQNLTLNGGSDLNNFCKLIVNKIFTINANVQNSSLINVLGDTYINGNGSVQLYTRAMFQTVNLTNMDGKVQGVGTTMPSLFKVTGKVDDKVKNNSGLFFGIVQFCHPTISIGDKHFLAPAAAGCGLSIPITTCNDIGNGATTPPVVKPDTDGDGIIDEQDAYPSDASKAFNNYSVNYTAGGSTIAFEDSWPLRGDYDLNDVVLNSKYLLITNSNNVVVQIRADYVLKATGADYHNAAGIQFHLPAASAKIVSASTGTYLEAKQDSVVVMLFNDSRTEQATGNTEPGKTTSAFKNYSIVLDITSGPLLANLGVGTYNPFIWNNMPGFGRGYETHMYGKSPTNLANLKLFGTLDDRSVLGKYYTTVNNLPWAIELPVANFGYMIERVDITKGYTKFADWANSGGILFPDWYTNAGYINSTYIYTK